MSRPAIPTAQERRLIAAVAMMPERQVLRVYRDPEHRARGNIERVRRAAAELGIAAPPDPSARQEPA